MDSLSVLLCGMAAASCLYHGLSTWWLRRWLKRPGKTSSSTAQLPLPAVTFFRPLKSGVPDLSGKIGMLARAMQSGDQVIFGVEADSEEEACCAAVQREFPERDIVVVRCAADVTVNPKISKLAQMEAAARHEYWILSDSEVVADERFFTAFRQEWIGCDALTAGYRFIGLAQWPHRLDAAATLLTLWPGLAAVWRSRRVSFTLGACTAFRRGDLSAIGGWRAFGGFLAEDQRIGAALAASGKRIRLSAQVATLDSDPLSWRDYWRHQWRVAATYRVANPGGFAGSIAVQGVTASLALVILNPIEAWRWGVFGATLAVRWILAWRMARLLAFPIPTLLPVALLASLVETACWFLSWGTRGVWWGGKRWALTRAGRIARRP